MQGILVKSELVLQISNFMLIQKVKTLSINMMGKQILRLLKNNKLVIIFLYFTFIVYSCKNNKEREMIINNQNGLSGHLEQIIECFIEEYNIQGKSIYISEQYPTLEDKHPIFKKGISKYVYISMITYTPSDIRPNRILYTTGMSNYTLFYAIDKDREMTISNDLIWKRMILPKREEPDGKDFPIIIDYIETHFLYNIDENRIELSDFKSESCKGRLDDKYEW